MQPDLPYRMSIRFNFALFGFQFEILRKKVVMITLGQKNPKMWII